MKKEKSESIFHIPGSVVCEMRRLHSDVYSFGGQGWGNTDRILKVASLRAVSVFLKIEIS